MPNRKIIIATAAGIIALAMMFGTYVSTLSISTQFSGEYFSILVSGEGNYTYSFAGIKDGEFGNVSVGLFFPRGANISKTNGGLVSKTGTSTILGWSFDKISAGQSTSLDFTSDADPTETQILATYTETQTEKIAQAISFSSEKKERKLLPLTPYGNLSKIILNISMSTEKNKEQEFEILLDPDYDNKNDNEDEIADGKFEGATSILVSFSPPQGKYAASPYIAISSNKKTSAVINSIEALWTKKVFVQESAQIISLPTTTSATTTTLPPTTTTAIPPTTTTTAVPSTTSSSTTEPSTTSSTLTNATSTTTTTLPATTSSTTTSSSSTTTLATTTTLNTTTTTTTQPNETTTTEPPATSSSTTTTIENTTNASATTTTISANAAATSTTIAPVQQAAGSNQLSAPSATVSEVSNAAPATTQQTTTTSTTNAAAHVQQLSETATTSAAATKSPAESAAFSAIQ